MYDFVFLWLSWLLFCFPSFFMSRSVYRTLYMIALLTIIILFPYHIGINGFVFSISHLFILTWCTIAFIKLKLALKNYIFVLFIAYIYTIYFLWKITSPVLDEYTFLIIAILACMTLNQFIKASLHHKIYMWVCGVSYGHLLYSLISHSYHLHDFKNASYYFILLLTILLFLAIQTSWKKWQFKIENWLQLLENKKRWNS